MMYDLIIIGGGPAGITAGIYASRQKLNTLLITKNFGGQVTRKAVKIENYPGFLEISGQQLIEKLVNHLKSYPVSIELDEVSKVEKKEGGFLVRTKNQKTFEAKAIIVTSGADPRPLEAEREKEFIGKGVSYCVTCDGPLFKGKTVAVVGGGNAGFEAAIFLSDFAKKIYILEYNPQPAADEKNQTEAQKTGKVELITNAKVKKILGKDFVEGLIYEDRETGQEKELSVKGIFIEIGSQPATSFVKGLVEFNERDEIKVNPFTGETSTPGIFAAGDADDVPYKQIIIACGEGAKAALSAISYLKNLKKKA